MGDSRKVPEWRETLHPLLKGVALMELVSGDVVTMCRFNIFERLVLPAHSHPQEQIAYVINGKMKMRIGNLERMLGPGDVQIVSGNVEHSAEILEVPFQEIDVFSPVRHDFLESCAATSSDILKFE